MITRIGLARRKEGFNFSYYTNEEKAGFPFELVSEGQREIFVWEELGWREVDRVEFGKRVGR
jgi:hypothetical protein